ncbi:MAG: (Fe-S)-binding protein [Pirellulales bacterium]|nr:(Fe-S)-binding protein [Pirellulales bacterium]
MTKVGLFIPCYVDQCFPEVGMATVRLLEKLGCEVDFPPAQTCCGQPMANTGCDDDARPLAEKFLEIFRDYPYVVCPSGSCTSMVRHHYEGLIGGQPGFDELKNKTYELCEFINDVLEVDQIDGRFPHRVGIHQSCHGLRELRLASGSERVVEPFSKVRNLLESLEDIELVNLERPDECCGFGGTFSVAEEAVSCMMGQDRIADHRRAGTEVMTGVDMSCLMHLDGLMRRDGMQHGKPAPLRVMHVAEILSAAAG